MVPTRTIPACGIPVNARWRTPWGFADKAALLGPQVIRDFMPEEYRELFGKLRLVVAAGVDADGASFTRLRTGAPGFLASPNLRTLDLAAAPAPEDPLAQILRVGAAVELLGIELPTRRRNRMNGILQHATGGHWRVVVTESSGNCPENIATRRPRRRVAAALPADKMTTLNRDAQRLSEAADTLY
jgi:predicted pyridoxine 5'-phosphate oxidase superfamily flavin-nucleotide-binding protein